MRSITFYSYKGGVGRTLAMANVAHYLAQLGQKVVAVDLDLEAPGLHYKLKPRRPIERGIVDLAAEFIDGHRFGPISSCLAPVWESPDGGSITLLAAGQAPSAEYWQKFTSVDWRSFLVGAEAATSDDTVDGLAFFLELKEHIAQELAPDYLLMDARTGITELGGIASSILADDVVCFFARNDESIDGTREAIRALGKSPRLAATQPLRVFPVLARLPDLDDEEETQIVRDVSERLALTTLAFVEPLIIVHSYPGLQVHERVLMAEDDPQVLESQLYADYARFFALILPPHIAQTSLQRSIEDAKRLAFKSPSEAERILLRIAHRQPHVQSYRALLEFYRLRSERAEKLLESARRLAELADDYGDELVWSTITENLDEIESEPKREILRFVERAWRDRDASNVEVGLRLGEAWGDSGDTKRAAAVLISLAEAQREIDGELLARILFDLRRAGFAKTALQLAPLVRRELRSPAVQRAWGRVITTAQDREEAAAMLSRPDVSEGSFRARPRTWFDLLRLAGEQDRVIPTAERLSDELLAQIKSEGFTLRHETSALQLFEALSLDGRGRRFLQRLRETLTRATDKTRLKRIERRLRLDDDNESDQQ